MTAPQLPPGHVVAGKYSIVGVLGYGGTSATYRAAGADARSFAVKIFDPALAQRADVMASLEQVYGASNALGGADAASIVDAGYDAQTGAPFSVTEVLPYPSLAGVVGQRPLSMEDVAVLVQALARVLDAAHARQLLHLALKPTNVFVAPAPSRGVTLTDFGAAYARGAVPSQEGHALAAPWMAPEQLRQGVPIGPAADVFSTALLVFYALTGRSYWRSCASASPDFSGLAREIIAPRAPASVRAAELGVPLSAALDVVLARALAVDPGERYRSVGELAGGISAVLGGARSDGATAVLDTSMLAGPSEGARGTPSPAAGAPPAEDPLGSTMAIPEGAMYPGPSPYGPSPALRNPSPMAMGSYSQGGPAPDAPASGGMGGASQVAPAQGAMPVVDAGPPSVLQPAGVPRRGKALPVVLAAGIVLLLGGVAAFLIAGRRARPVDAGPIVVAAASGEAAAASAGAQPAVSAVPTPSAEPAASASAAPSADVEVALSCKPACDEISIDGEKLGDPSKPVTLPPGAHKVSVAKAGFASQADTITLEAGKRFDKQYKLVVKPSTPTVPVKVPPRKNCGKFLKRCD